MVMAVGLSTPRQGPTAAMYHLTTHAFFKALLFLGAGSVLCACHHEQDIWRMGGLKKKMPVTFWTFLLGMLALCGVPPFSGFFSKDAILASALDHNVVLFLTATCLEAGNTADIWSTQDLKNQSEKLAPEAESKTIAGKTLAA